MSKLARAALEHLEADEKLDVAFGGLAAGLVFRRGLIPYPGELLPGCLIVTHAGVQLALVVIRLAAAIRTDIQLRDIDCPGSRWPPGRLGGSGLQRYRCTHGNQRTDLPSAAETGRRMLVGKNRVPPVDASIGCHQKLAVAARDGAVSGITIRPHDANR